MQKEKQKPEIKNNFIIFENKNGFIKILISEISLIQVSYNTIYFTTKIGKNFDINSRDFNSELHFNQLKNIFKDL